MPTGYTAGVADGKINTFREFALTCARNFGIAILQRDEPFGEIRYVTEEDCGIPRYREKISEAERLITEFHDKSIKNLKILAREAYEDELARHNKYREEKSTTRKRYHRMIEEVTDWEPPTPEHVNLKKFMLEQLEESIKFDCNFESNAPKEMNPEEFRAQQIANHKHSLEFYKTELARAEKRFKEGNAWIRALDESLPKK